MKPLEKVKDLPMTPLTKEEIAERAEDIHSVIKRISKVTQSLEVEGLDVMTCIKSLSEGKFPAEHITSVYFNLQKFSTEITSIAEKWNKIFDKEIGEKRGIK